MNHPLESLGWMLVHFCWQAAAIALFFWLAEMRLSITRSHVRYVLALGAMVLMLASAVGTFIYEETRDRTAVAAAHAAAAAEMSHLDASPSGWTGDALSQPWDLRSTGRLAIADRFSRVLPWLDFVWILGVAGLSLRTIGGWWLIQRLRRSALIEVPPMVSERFSRLAQRLGIGRVVELKLSSRITGPLAMGVFRPLVLLPASALLALNPDQLEAVLAHELAHIRRADYFWNLFQTAMEILFFFHPAVWWLGRKVRQERELCCDDVAVSSCADPVVFATALLRLEERRVQEPALAMALDGHGRWVGLRARIARILGEEERRVQKQSVGVLASAPLLLVVGLIALLGLPPRRMFARPATPVLASQAPPLPLSSAAPAPDLEPGPEPGPASSLAAAPITVKLPASKPAPSNPVPMAPVRVVKPGMTLANMAMPDVAALPVLAPNPLVEVAALSADAHMQNTGSAASSPDYIDRMRAAGYDEDLDKYIAMKMQGITPEYASDMAKAGFGKPSADQLIAMKVQGVTPQYVTELHGAGISPSGFSDLVSFKIFGVTPEFVAGMKAAGFDSIPAHKLMELRVHGVTPEYAKRVKQQYPNITPDELAQLRIFRIDDAFLAAAKRHGFDGLPIQKLVQLRLSGLLNDESVEAK